MRSALPPAVPSRRLLRYLRFQSEGIPFFSPHGHDQQQPRRLISGLPPKYPEVLPRPATTAFDVSTVLPKHAKRVRFASTGGDKPKPKSTMSERLWGPNTVTPDFRSRSTDELDTTIFTTSMTARRAKAAFEPVLRCTEVDEKGDAILTDGAFKKTELIAKVPPSSH